MSSWQEFFFWSGIIYTWIIGGVLLSMAVELARDLYDSWRWRRGRL